MKNKPIPSPLQTTEYTAQKMQRIEANAVSLLDEPMKILREWEVWDKKITLFNIPIFIVGAGLHVAGMILFGWIAFPITAFVMFIPAMITFYSMQQLRIASAKSDGIFFALHYLFGGK